MRYPASEKLEIIRVVEQSHLSVRRTLAQIGVPPVTFYRWYDLYQTGGHEALEDRSPRPKQAWNRIPGEVRERIVQLALDEPELSPRELAVRFTDTESYFVSEASVYRNRGAAGATWALRHLPDGRGCHPTPRLRRHPDHDQHPARAAAIRGARMTVHPTRSATTNAADRNSVFENRSDYAADGRISPIGCSPRPARGMLRALQLNVWKNTFAGYSFTPRHPNGKCRLGNVG